MHYVACIDCDNIDFSKGFNLITLQDRFERFDQFLQLFCAFTVKFVFIIKKFLYPFFGVSVISMGGMIDTKFFLSIFRLCCATTRPNAKMSPGLRMIAGGKTFSATVLDNLMHHAGFVGIKVVRRNIAN